MNILGVIPARKGSKGIRRKNILPLHNKPLIAYTIEAALRSKSITRIILTSDCAETIRIARRYGVEAPFIRPRALAGDTIPALPVAQHAIRFLEKKEQYKPDYIVWLQPTSPLRTARHIDEAIKKLIHSDADSIVSVAKVPHNFAPHSIMQYKKRFLKPYLSIRERKNLRQLKPVFYARNGAAIYVFTYQCLMEKNSFYGKKILAYEMEKEDSIDIDDTFDVKICEYLLSHHKHA